MRAGARRVQRSGLGRHRLGSPGSLPLDLVDLSRDHTTIVCVSGREVRDSTCLNEVLCQGETAGDVISEPLLLLLRQYVSEELTALSEVINVTL